ncbi:Flp family type IVb pilin [Alloacidobacterium sp.]|uniref:Flp family type IVb pilin n=1 Tax=Alloacidobacterium sp. TaxID=2951999 RepID=UPI002D633BF5|nr:Flp family type IVb pilin [Alloacidobacterium sp.]HYK37613.1 Flp family type IVb pilin [Alloacidobacterium sp.]
MQHKMLKFYIKIQSLIMREEGQDLIEYALVVALIAFAAAATMQSLSSSINNAFSGISNALNTYAP